MPSKRKGLSFFRQMLPEDRVCACEDNSTDRAVLREVTRLRLEEREKVVNGRSIQQFKIVETSAPPRATHRDPLTDFLRDSLTFLSRSCLRAYCPMSSARVLVALMLYFKRI